MTERCNDQCNLRRDDAENVFLRSDDEKRLGTENQVQQSMLSSWPPQAELMAGQLKELGIKAGVKMLERCGAATRVRDGQAHINFSMKCGTESLFLYSRHALPLTSRVSK